MLIGEAWGEQEEREKRPFVGASGRLLNSLLDIAGIPREECYITNVFNLRPQPTNDVKNLCGPKSNAVPGYPPLAQGKYVRAEFKPELDRLEHEIKSVKPNLIVALGATPTWATLKLNGIKKYRGAPAMGIHGIKVLPTYHPAAIMRQYKLRPIVIADLQKAKRESEFPEIRRPMREIWVEPTIEDIIRFRDEYIVPSRQCTADIETIARMITCISFAPSIDRAIVIPFFDERKPSKNYWSTFEEEREAWNLVAQILGMPKKWAGQNFIYDMKFLWTEMGITVPDMADDTMLLHHALQPELEKGLAFLGTIYTDEAAWKLDRKTGTVKRED